jgi:hypothetical protein
MFRNRVLGRTLRHSLDRCPAVDVHLMHEVVGVQVGSDLRARL